MVTFVMMRLLVPAEGPELGHTLWITTFGFLAAGLVAMVCWKRGTAKLRGTPADVAVLCLIAGHLLSALLVLTGEGHQRAALNLFWEWTFLAICWWWLRVTLDSPSARGRLMTAFCITAATLAGLGLWQHYILYPQQSQDFERYLELIEAGPGTVTGSAEFQRLAEQFGTEPVMLDEAARMSMRARVRDSVEPIGRYALANTFALLLLIALLALADQWLLHWRELKVPNRVVISLLGLLMLGCLVLTKSRTAWLAALIGLGVLSQSRLTANGEPTRRPRWIFPLAFTSLGMIVVVTTLTGGLDRQVISEAPKSLQYRLEYWSSTLSLLREHFWLGVGPGQFRQHYQQYKLPGASEDILDPHNLFLGTWAGGGLLALAGLITLFAWCLKRHSTQREPASLLFSPRMFAPCLLAPFTLYGVLLLIEQMDDPVLPVLAIAAGTLGLLFWKIQLTIEIDSILARVLLLVSGIHLLASSGIEMPAIVTLLVSFASMTFPSSTSESNETVTSRSRQPLIVAALSIVAFGMCLKTALVPTQIVAAELAAAQYAQVAQGNLSSARRALQRAIAADPLDPEPHQRMALLELAAWERSPRRETRPFEAAIRSQTEAIRRDPHSAGRYRMLGDLWNRRFQKSGLMEHALHAATAYQQAANRYPNSAIIQAELALALQAAQHNAIEAAERALVLDNLNHAQGHTDKLLPPATRTALEQLTQRAANGPVPRAEASAEL